MTPIIILPEEAQKIGKEFLYRCKCGMYLRSDQKTTCPDCGQVYEWPETPGSKLLAKKARAKAADLKAKDRERKLSVAASFVTLMAKMGEPAPDTVFIKSFLNDTEQAQKAAGQRVPTELQWIDSIDPDVVQEKAQELHKAGDHGRGLIVHLVNWIKKTGGTQVKAPEVASQTTSGYRL
jgi:hypothetical protein